MTDEKAPKESTIAEQARVCHKLYEQCLTVASKAHEHGDIWNPLAHGYSSDAKTREFQTEGPNRRPSLLTVLRNQLGRFNIWTSQIGVFAQFRLSMDYRLRDAPDMRILILQLLDSLQGNLSHFESLLKLKSNAPSADLPGHPGIIDAVSGNITAIDENVSRLLRLSNAIHRAGAENRNLRATKYILKDEEGNDIGEDWRQNFALALCAKQYPASSELVRERLATAMLNRRKRIAYRRSRQEKLAINLQSPERRGVMKLQKMEMPISQPQSSSIDNSSRIERSVNVSISQSAKTTDSAATPLPLQKVHTPSVVSRISSTQSLKLDDETKLRFPPPPVAGSTPEILCPYCCLILPAQQAEDTKWWRRHVVHDLEPFVCLDENCLEPQVLFSDEKAWINHIRTQHRQQWRCTVKRHRGTGPTTFNTQDDFENHMKVEHRGAFPEKQLSLLSKANSKPAGATSSFCPICGPEGTPDIETGQSEVPSPMDRHIIGHLMLLALRSMPWVDTGNEEGSSDRSTKPETRGTIREFIGSRIDWSESEVAGVETLSPPLCESSDFVDDKLSALGRQTEWGFMLGDPDSAVDNYDPVLRPFVMDSDWFKDYIITRRRTEPLFRLERPPRYDWSYLQRLPAYNWWRKHERGLLLLYGGVGVGKSAWMECALHLARSQLSHSKTLVLPILYLRKQPDPDGSTYSNRNNGIELDDIYRELHYELAVQMGDFPIVSSLLQKAQHNAKHHDIAQKLLQIALRSCSIQIYVDLEDRQISVGIGFLTWLKDVCGPHAKIQIMITTRSLHITRNSGFEWRHIPVHSNLRQGMKSIISSHVQKSTISIEAEQEILAHSWDNLFWAEEMLAQLATDADVDFWLREQHDLPSPAAQIFGDHTAPFENCVWYPDYAQRGSIYLWLLNGPSLLTVEQLAAVLTLELHMRDTKSKATRLIILSDDDVHEIVEMLTIGMVHLSEKKTGSVFEFIHPIVRNSVQNFYTGDPDMFIRFWRLPFVWLDYASSSSETGMLEHTFTKYVCQHFLYFLSNMLTDTCGITAFYQTDWDSILLQWLQIRDPIATTAIKLQSDHSTKLIHVAAVHNLLDVVSRLESLIKEAPPAVLPHLDITSKDSLGRTSLFLAEQAGGDEMVNLILKLTQQDSHDAVVVAGPLEDPTTGVREDGYGADEISKFQHKGFTQTMHTGVEIMPIRAFAIGKITSPFHPPRVSSINQSSGKFQPTTFWTVIMPVQVIICCKCAIWNAYHSEEEFSCSMCTETRCDNCRYARWSSKLFPGTWKCCKCAISTSSHSLKCSKCQHSRCSVHCSLEDLVVDTALLIGDVTEYYTNHQVPIRSSKASMQEPPALAATVRSRESLIQGPQKPRWEKVIPAIRRRQSA